MNAPVCVQVGAVQGESVEQAVNCPQRAQIFAEGPVDHQAGRRDPEQHKELPQENASQLGAHHAVPSGQQDPRQGAGGAEVLAEEGRQGIQQRKNHHQQHQNGIFQPAQRPVQPEVIPLVYAGNFIQQLLKKPKGAQKAAYGPPQHRAEKQQQS